MAEKTFDEKFLAEKILAEKISPRRKWWPRRPRIVFVGVRESSEKEKKIGHQYPRSGLPGGSGVDGSPPRSVHLEGLSIRTCR